MCMTIDDNIKNLNLVKIHVLNKKKKKRKKKYSAIVLRCRTVLVVMWGMGINSVGSFLR